MRLATRATVLLFAALAAGFSAGCQQAEIIFHRHQPLTIAAAETPAPSPKAERVDTTILASYQDPEKSQHKPDAANSSSSPDLRPRVLDPVSSAAGLMSGPTPRQVEQPSQFSAASQPATQLSAPPATQPAAPSTTQPGYTAPAISIRYATLGMGMASVAIGAPDTVGGGREAAEAQVFGSTALLTGAPGLAAPSPSVLDTVVSQPGLIRGAAAGLGSAGPNNFFNRQVNPASGPNGVNAELRRAGFPTNNIPGRQRISHRR